MKVEKLKSVIKGGCCVDIDPCYYPDDYCLKKERGKMTRTTAFRQSKNLRLGFRINQCPTPATHLMDGKTYCTHHAGQLALDELMRTPPVE